jgi:two-component system chemotaxis sensor kinase CheA
LALDMDRYRGLFLEEANEHLADMSSALLALEKDCASVESIDVVFRMAHSIKSMAATLSYDAISELAHALEDHMEGIRSAARVEGPEALPLLFRGLEGLEQMVAVVRETGEPPEARAELLAALRSPTPDPLTPLELEAEPDRGPEKKA